MNSGFQAFALTVPLVLALAAAATTGCVTSRGELKLEMPAAQSASTSAGRIVVIGAVRDLRVFQDHPDKPSIPSLGFGGPVEKVPDSIKQRAIARKRSNWGIAYGDILLEEGQTVEGLVRAAVASALESCGFRVRDHAGGEGKGAARVDVNVQKFWGWFNPGVGKTYLNAWTETKFAITVDGRTRLVPVERRIKKNVHGMAAGRHWKECFEDLLKAYVDDVKSKVCAGLSHP